MSSKRIFLNEVNVKEHSRRDLLSDETGASAIVELVLMLPLAMVAGFAIFNMFQLNLAEDQIQSELRDAARMTASYGGDCGLYRPTPMIQSGGQCGGTGITGGQSVSEKVTAERLKPQFSKAFHVSPSSGGTFSAGNGIQCKNGWGFGQADKGQTKYVGDTITCGLKWKYHPVGMPFSFGMERISIQVASAEVGEL